MKRPSPTLNKPYASLRMRSGSRVIVAMARAPVRQGAEYVGAEKNEHDADARLEGLCHLVGHLVTQQQHAHTGDEQRECMAETPQAAHEQRTQQAATLR